MLSQHALDVFIQYWYIAIGATILGHYLNNRFFTGLNKLPSVEWSAWSNWWRFLTAARRQTQFTHIEMHEKYGDVVRIGPKAVSFANPQALKEIYGHAQGYIKSDFYKVHQTLSKGYRHPSLFSAIDEDYHATLRRCVSNAFAMSTLVSYEPLVDSTLKAFISQTGKRLIDNKEKVSFSRWLQFAAFDVIGEIAWSKRLGFVDTGKDEDNIINKVSWAFTYAQIIGQQPWIDHFWDKNPLKMMAARLGLLRHGGDDPIAAFALQRMAERDNEESKGAISAVDEDGNPRGVDFLERFQKSQKEHPEFMDHSRLLATQISLIMAGSDTTGIIMAATFHFLLQNPRCYAKLMAEIDSAVLDGTIASHPQGLVSWTSSQKLPYLDAVITESFRLHSPVGTLLERVTPPGGRTICGEHIPGGTIVGCNPWVIHRRPEIFGDDALQWRPERWLESPAAKLKEMRAHMFHFGGGARTCIGRNISTMELYKMIPTFLRHFEIALEDNANDWTLSTHFLVKQEDFHVKLTRREITKLV